MTPGKKGPKKGTRDDVAFFHGDAMGRDAMCAMRWEATRVEDRAIRAEISLFRAATMCAPLRANASAYSRITVRSKGGRRVYRASARRL